MSDPSELISSPTLSVSSNARSNSCTNCSTRFVRIPSNAALLSLFRPISYTQLTQCFILTTTLRSISRSNFLYMPSLFATSYLARHSSISLQLQLYRLSLRSIFSLFQSRLGNLTNSMNSPAHNFRMAHLLRQRKRPLKSLLELLHSLREDPVKGGARGRRLMGGRTGERDLSRKKNFHLGGSLSVSVNIRQLSKV